MSCGSAIQYLSCSGLESRSCSEASEPKGGLDKEKRPSKPRRKRSLRETGRKSYRASYASSLISRGIRRRMFGHTMDRIGHAREKLSLNFGYQGLYARRKVPWSHRPSMLKYWDTAIYPNASVAYCPSSRRTGFAPSTHPIPPARASVAPDVALNSRSLFLILPSPSNP